MDGWLLAMSDEDIGMAIDAIYDSKVCAELTISRPDLMVIWANPSTQNQAEHLARCGFDRTLAILSWNDRARDQV